MGYKMDFDGEDEGFAPLDEGVYDARVKSAIVKSNKKNTGMILELIFEIPTGTYAGRQLRDWPSLSAAAAWRVRGVLEAITQEPWREAQMEIEPKELIGQMVRLIVVQEPHYEPERAAKGEIQNKIKDYLPYLGEDDSPESGISGYTPL